MFLATRKKIGRTAIAHAVSLRPIHVAWGIGQTTWGESTDYEPIMESIIENGLYAEVGRRTPTVVGFVEPDPDGDIIIPVSETETAYYKRVDDPTPYLYVKAAFEYNEASDAVIREIAVCTETVLVDGLPPGQRYFTPDQVVSKGYALAALAFQPPQNRVPYIRPTYHFVIPF
ncbi:hypothetical protein LJC71_05015 [Desulfosarcina sp. OttesenSCG-928-A07]|nr:hypothetical protein [Desulfosarcina sp. OttesenSCG-928-G17]MDL2329099.1 hypothetical protein [Desulfosarcina sp. OttesenSCG-928-A07]